MIRVILCLLSLVGMGTAAVAQDVWPALYDVTGVASDDTLNVRAGPGADTAIIGTLAPTAQNVEVIRPNGDGTWALVNMGEQSGWTSLRFLARQPDQTALALPKHLTCFGTEPFWTLKVEGPLTPDANASWSTPEGTTALSLKNAQRSTNRIGVFGLNGTGAGQSFTAAVRRGYCNDGMSDAEFGLTADVIRLFETEPSQVYSGCCTLTP